MLLKIFLTTKYFSGFSERAQKGKVSPANKQFLPQLKTLAQLMSPHYHQLAVRNFNSRI